MPWGRSNKRDLAWFADQTADGILIAGSTTAHSMPSPLGRGRSVYVWHRYNNPKEMIDFLSGTFPDKNIWIVGGAMTYAAFMPFVERLYIGRVDYDGPADTWFPLDLLVNR